MNLRFIAVLAAAGLLAGCGDSGGAGNVWRFALEEVEGSVQWEYARRFEELVEARSGGEIDVRIYPYGSLGTSADLTQQVQQGALQFTFASPGHLGSVVPEVQLFVLHFVLSDDSELNHRVLTGSRELHELMDAAYRQRGLALYSVVPEGWMVWTANRPLREPADFRGLKIRTMVSPLLVQAYRAYGANPTPMPYGEVYGALQLGVIDAQVNPVFAIEEMSFYEVQEVMSFARHSQFVATVAANPAFLDGLSDRQRQMLDDVRTELADYVFDVQQRLNEERLDIIDRNSDIRMVELTDAQREVFRELSMPVRDRYVRLAGPRGEALLDTLTEAVSASRDGGGKPDDI